MGTISVIEFIVYGFLCYTSILMLILSVAKEVPTGRNSSILRCIYLIPGLICAGVLASSGVDIQTKVDATNNIIKNLNDSSTWQETTTQVTSIVLQNPIWITVHFLIFAVLLIYILFQILSIFGYATDPRKIN